MAKVTLQDVAAKAGVSIALVSYVLNGVKKDRISKETAERIQQAIKELDYRPNYLARSFKKKKTFNIGLLVADIANPFSSQLARIVGNEAEAAGYTITIGSSDESAARFEKLVRSSLDRQVDGFILAAPEGSESILEYLKNEHIPVVIIDRYFPTIKINSVAVDNYESSRRVMDEFAKLGKTNIAIIGYQTQLHHLNDRIRGAVEGMHPAMVEPIIKYISEANIEADMEDTIGLLMHQGINGFFFASNKLGESGLRHLITNGARIPDDIAVISFDGTDAYNFYPNAIGCIRQPLAEMGSQAFQLLLKQIENPSMPVKQIVLKTSFSYTKPIKSQL